MSVFCHIYEKLSGIKITAAEIYFKACFYLGVSSFLFFIFSEAFTSYISIIPDVPRLDNLSLIWHLNTIKLSYLLQIGGVAPFLTRSNWWSKAVWFNRRAGRSASM